ncbi:MAG: chitosanase [Gemmataceae bacterium]
MAKTPAAPAPSKTRVANKNAIATINARQKKLDELADQTAAKQADPAYSTPDQQAKLQQIQDDIAKSQQMLAEEKAIREEIESAYDQAPEPKKADTDPAVKAGMDKLKTHRKSTYPKQYATTNVGDPCVACMAKQLKGVKPALQPQNEYEMIETITGIFEGGVPSYCTYADNPKDKGKMSYGKHQASETSGHLKAMLQNYVDRTDDPAPDPVKAQGVRDQMKNFKSGGKSFSENANDRAAMKKALKEACSDPAMRRTQDEYFRTKFYDPAMKKAAKYGVTSPLGKSIFYDNEIQGPALTEGFAEKSLKEWNKAHPNQPPAKACAPEDPNGPDEATFLKGMNKARREKMNAADKDNAYHNTTYRPDEHDKLIDSGNMQLDKDFNTRGQPVKGIPPYGPPAPTTTPEPPHLS